MRHIQVFLLSLLGVVLLTATSFAGTVNMQFLSVGGQSIGGEYTYPYYFSINGSSTLTPLICDTYSNQITFGESWTANVYNLSSGQGLWSFEPNSLQNYEAAAIIFGEILNGTIAGPQGNLAIWGLFDGGRNNSGWTPYEQQIINAALASTYRNGASYYSQFMVYTPVGASPGNGPQEFIGYVGSGTPTPALAEPTTLSVLGMGLLTMAFFLWRNARA